MIEYTNDYLLDLKVKIFQPVDGYRASTDAVLLSSLISNIRPQEKILDVGSGTGAVSLCLAHRLQSLAPQITGLEIQPELAELSNLSAQANNFSDHLSYINKDINQPSGLDYCSFDRVISNPPYSFADQPSPNHSKAQAHNLHNTDLSGWIKFCLKMLKPFGYLYLINRAEAVSEILSSLHKKTGNITLIPIYSKAGQNAKRIMIIAQKDSKAPAVIHSGIIVHQPDGNYSPSAQQILRDGKGFFDI